VAKASWIAAALAAVLLVALLALAEESPSDQKLTDLVRILREQGVINDDQYVELSSEAAKKQEKRSWVDRFSVWGDFRARYEGFFYERDAVARALETPPDPADAVRLEDRHRGRYRARLNIRAEVASRAAVYLRLASGEGQSANSTNQSFGRGVDFDNDGFNIDLAYATISPFPNGELPGVQDGYFAIDIGKVVNPFLWDAMAADQLLWDPDITPEGGNVRLRATLGPFQLFSNTGYYIIDENGEFKSLTGGATSQDPQLVATQLGTLVRIVDGVALGVRGSFYNFFSLDPSFFTRAAALGNIPGGLGSSDDVQVVEGSAFVDLGLIDLLPIQLFATISYNLSARRPAFAPFIDREGNGYWFGARFGDKKKLVQLAVIYAFLEANAFPAMFVDSDITDGITNRQAWVFKANRQLFENVELALWASVGRPIERGIPYAVSVLGSNRVRFQADLNFKF
jgi:Putative porin